MFENKREGVAAVLARLRTLLHEEAYFIEYPLILREQVPFSLSHPP